MSGALVGLVALVALAVAVAVASDTEGAGPRREGPSPRLIQMPQGAGAPPSPRTADDTGNPGGAGPTVSNDQQAADVAMRFLDAYRHWELGRVRPDDIVRLRRTSITRLFAELMRRPPASKGSPAVAPVIRSLHVFREAHGDLAIVELDDGSMPRALALRVLRVSGEPRVAAIEP